MRRPSSTTRRTVLAIAREVDNRAGGGQGYGNLGIAYESQGDYAKAIKYHTQDLAIAKEVGDRAGEVRDAKLLQLGLLLNSATWTCLDNALNGGALVHSTPTQEFSYAKAKSENYADIDSCMAFLGPEGAKMKGALAQGVPSRMAQCGLGARQRVNK